MKKILLPLLLMSSVAIADTSIPLTAGQWVIVNNSNCRMTLGYTIMQPSPSRQISFGQLNLTAMSSNISSPLRTPFIYKPSNSYPYQVFNLNNLSLCNVQQDFDPTTCTATYTPQMTKTFVFTLTPILGSTTVSCTVSAF